MKRINHGTAARATTTLLAASLLIAGVFVASAQAAATCRVRPNHHIVYCSNSTANTYEMRVRVLLENNKRPRFQFTLDPSERWKKRFNKRVVGLRVDRKLVVTGIGLYAYGGSTTWMDYLATGTHQASVTINEGDLAPATEATVSCQVASTQGGATLGSGQGQLTSGAGPTMFSFPISAPSDGFYIMTCGATANAQVSTDHFVVYVEVAVN